MKAALIALLVLAMASPAMAVLGLPIAEDAVPQAGLMRVGAGVTIESDVNLYGARFTYGATDDLSVFAGVGLIDIDGLDSEPYFQAGGLYGLDLDLPFDLAVRAAFGITSFDETEATPYGRVKIELDVWTLNVGALGSKPVTEQITAYGFAGLSYQKYDGSGSFNGFRVSHSDSDTELAIAGGAIYALDEAISFYGELAFIDDLFLSVGGRYRF